MNIQSLASIGTLTVLLSPLAFIWQKSIAEAGVPGEEYRKIKLPSLKE